MSVADFAFYVFALVAVVAALLVVTARNPVHSVLWLILTFLSAAGLFVLLGAEFLAMLLMIVYVGAVAVLFLFVVMMLDIDFVELRQGFMQYLPIGVLVGLIFLAELLMVAGAWVFAPEATATASAPIPDPTQVSNTLALGQLLYTRYVYFFQVAGFVLLVAMIGAITLTLRHRASVRRQNISVQVARTRATAIEVKHVEPGRGL